MKWPQKLLIVICSLVLLVAIIDIGLNYWVKFHLPKIINKKQDSVYFITYKDIDVSLFKSVIKIHHAVILPRSRIKDTLNKEGIYGHVPIIVIEKFKLLPFLFNDRLKAKSITFDKPNAILYLRKDQPDINKSVVAPFEKIITVNDVFLNHGDFKFMDVKDSTTILSVRNINFNVDGIVITDKTLKEKIPLKFTEYTFRCDSIYYHPNEFYRIKTQKVLSTKTALRIDKFEMLPNYSRHQFVSKIKAEKDLYTLLCDSVKVSNLDWGFNKEDLFVHCNSVNLHQASANIYRSKEPPDDLRKKHLYNKLLRDLDFDLRVDTLKIHRSVLEYEEEKSAEFGAGKLSFTNFNLTATSICSGFKKASLPDLKIKIDCRFMNDSPFHINWKLNVMDKSDGFNINGVLANFDAEKIIPFSKPYMNITTKGTIDEVRFNFSGNDSRNTGDFKVKYDDLKFTVYKKDDRKKKNKLMTFLTRIFVKKDTKDRLKDAQIEVERIPEKSFYNFFWRSVEQGLKKILLG